MIADPVSWFLLLVVCAVISGGLIANGLRLRRTNVVSETEAAPVTGEVERGEEAEIAGGLIRLSAAILVGGFTLVVLIAVASSLGSSGPGVAKPSAALWSTVGFLSMIVLCFLSLRSAGVRWED